MVRDAPTFRDARPAKNSVHATRAWPPSRRDRRAGTCASGSLGCRSEGAGTVAAPLSRSTRSGSRPHTTIDDRFDSDGSRPRSGLFRGRALGPPSVLRSTRSSSEGARRSRTALPRIYSSRARGDRARRKSGEGGSGAPRSEVRTDAEHRDVSPAARSRRRSWARLLRRIFEVDPLLCPRCGVEMKRVAVIQDVAVVDRILAHLRRIGGNDPWEGTAQRGPPAGAPPA